MFKKKNYKNEANLEALIFFSQSATFFKFIGLWRDNKNLREVRRTTIGPLVILGTGFLMLIMVVTGYFGTKSKRNQTKSLILLPVCCGLFVAAIKMFTIWNSIHGFKKCFQSLQTTAYKFENQFYISGALKVYRILFALGLVFVNTTAICFLNIPTIEGTRTFSLDVKNPVDIIDLMHSPFYEMIYAYQVIGGLIVSNAMVSLDTMFCGVMAMVTAILKSINDVFEEVFVTKTKENLPEEDKLKIFSEIIEIFLEIYRIIDFIKDIFNLVSLIHFMLNISVVGIGLYFISVLKFGDLLTISMTANIVLQIFQLRVYCYFGEAVVQQTQELRQNLYNCDWYNESKSFKFMILLSLQRLQNEPFIAAGKVVPFSLATFVDVMKKGAATYAFLHNVKNT